MADLGPVRDELTWEHIEGVAWRGAVLAPPVEGLGAVGPGLTRSVVQIAAASVDVVVLHLPRLPDDGVRWALEQCDRIVEVLSLDALSFRATTRFLRMGPSDLDERVVFVVNRAARGEIAPSDVRRVFGRDALGVIPHDAGVARAQDHGRLLPARGRIGRAFARLADGLWVSPAEEAA